MKPQPFHAAAGLKYLTKAEIISLKDKELRKLTHDLNNERSTITLLLDLIEEIYSYGSSAQRDKSLKSILVTAGRIK